MRHYNFLGLGGEIFSRGLYDLSDQMTEELNSSGTVYNWPEWKKVKRDILRGEEEDIVIVGHSLGARVAVKLSNALVEAGRPPKAVVCVDYVHNLAGMNDLKADKEVPTLHLMSKDFRVRKLKNATNKSYRGLNHLNIVKNKDLIHRKIIDFVKDNI